MMRREGEREIVPYQWTLRAIGAFLDEHASQRVLVIETADGFLVRYQPDGAGASLESVYFRYEKLLEFRTNLEARRTPPDEDRPEIQEAPVEMRGYQDLLRALGYVLEQVPAFSMLLDELEDGFLLTYQYFNPEENYLPRKHVTVLGSRDVDSLVQDARSRRSVKPPAGRLLWMWEKT